MGFFKKTKKEAQTLPEQKTAAPAAVIARSGLLSSRVLLRKPWTSEKAHLLQGQNQYVFLVDLKAKKPQIKKEVARHYGVRVADVNIILQKGKTKRLGRSTGKRSDFKKAIVTLAVGNKIEIT